MRSNAGAGAALNLKFEHAVRERNSVAAAFSPTKHSPAHSFCFPPPASPCDHPLPLPQVMSQFHRLPGLPSSYFGLDIISVRADCPQCNTPQFCPHARNTAPPPFLCIQLHNITAPWFISPDRLLLSLYPPCFPQGNDSRIGFEDTLNDPYMAPVQPHTHRTMEQVALFLWHARLRLPCCVRALVQCRCVTRMQILKLPALERDGARNPNPLSFNEKI